MLSTRIKELALVAFIAAGSAVLIAPALRSEGAVTARVPAPAAGGERGYAHELARLDRRIAAAERLVRAAPRSWMRRAELASLYLERAQLTGRLADYRPAEKRLAEALALGPYVPSLHLLKAQLDFTLHRFDEVEGHLAVPERDARAAGDDTMLASIHALRGSLALERGDDARAERLLQAAHAHHPSYDVLARLAHLHAATCRFDSATGLLSRAEEALGTRAPRALAWLHLQRGLMELERARHASALAWYERADAAYPGWWLIEEHIAEIDALEGRTNRALERYRRVVAETESPELMGALAGVLEARDASEAARWRGRAAEQFRHALRDFPEATYGHALDHFLEHGPAGEALRLAEANHRLRPNREAITKLAKAYLLAGRSSDALATLATIATTRWCHTDTHEARALASARSQSDVASP